MSHPRPAARPRPAPSTAWWGDRGVGVKILAAVGVTAAVAVGVGVMGIAALGTTADATSALYEGNVAGIADRRTMVDGAPRRAARVAATPSSRRRPS